MHDEQTGVIYIGQFGSLNVSKSRSNSVNRDRRTWTLYDSKVQATEWNIRDEAEEQLGDSVETTSPFVLKAAPRHCRESPLPFSRVASGLKFRYFQHNRAVITP